MADNSQEQIRPEILTPPPLDRRTFLQLLAAFLARVYGPSLRHAFGGAPFPSPRPDTNTPVLSQEQHPFTELEARAHLLSQALSKITILDVGKKPYSQAVIESLSPVDVWRILTGKPEITEEEYQEAVKNIEESLATTDNRTKVAMLFSWIGDHGSLVGDALYEGATELFGVEPDLTDIQFQSYIESVAQGLEAITVEKYGDIYSPSGMTKGTRWKVTIAEPKNVFSEGQIISGSFQVGSLMVDFWEERATKANRELTHHEVRALLELAGIDLPTFYNQNQDFDARFILPPDTTLADITQIEVTVRTPNDRVTTQIHPVSFAQDVLDTSEVTMTISQEQFEDTETYALYLANDARIEATHNPSAKDYHLTWERDEHLALREPDIYGAFAQENPEREDNLEKLRNFATSHPDNFFVMATGNYKDLLTAEELESLPQNIVLVGQATEMESFNQTSEVTERFISGTFGQTACEECIYAVTSSFGLDPEAEGSSLIVPNLALLVSLVALDADAPLTRRGLLQLLLKKDIISEKELADLQGTLYTVYVINGLQAQEMINNRINSMVKAPTQQSTKPPSSSGSTPATTLSRRQFLRGR